MHASDSGYAAYLNDWEPADEFLPFKPTAFRMVSMGKRPIEDTMAAVVCHGALTRNPDLRILSIENGASWVPYLLYQFSDVYSKMPQEFPEDPIEAFKRAVYVAPFWEDDFKKMSELCGVDGIIFGSDWPHPEGLAEPINLVDDLAAQGLTEEEQRKVMGGNLIRLCNLHDAATSLAITLSAVAESLSRFYPSSTRDHSGVPNATRPGNRRFRQNGWTFGSAAEPTLPTAARNSLSEVGRGVAQGSGL